MGAGGVGSVPHVCTVNDGLVVVPVARIRVAGESVDASVPPTKKLWSGVGIRRPEQIVPPGGFGAGRQQWRA
jgi:hypothetical protein